MENKRRIFIGYSHKDSEWLERLKTFLKPFEREADLEVWSDTNIQPSSLWEANIQKAINDADAAILLVSQDFLASDFIAQNELPHLLKAADERGLRIFPIIVSTGFFKNSPLSRFQSVNDIESPLDTLEKSVQNKIFSKLADSIDEFLKVSLEGVTEEWLEKFRSKFEAVMGGRYIMGDNENKLYALAEHEVEVESFSLGRYVVTQSEWMTIMKSQPWLGQQNVIYGDDVPAVYISWYDSFDFVSFLNRRDSKFAYRLPTEAEWEYAARGGQLVLDSARTKFCFGDKPDQLIHYGWCDRNASSRGNNYAHRVGMLKPNQLNLFDMHGNIWEWVADDIEGINLRAVRGGGFNFVAEGASSAFRLTQKAEVRSEAIGFRLVQEPK